MRPARISRNAFAYACAVPQSKQLRSRDRRSTRIQRSDWLRSRLRSAFLSLTAAWSGLHKPSASRRAPAVRASFRPSRRRIASTPRLHRGRERSSADAPARRGSNRARRRKEKKRKAHRIHPCTATVNDERIRRRGPAPAHRGPVRARGDDPQAEQAQLPTTDEVRSGCAKTPSRATRAPIPLNKPNPRAVGFSRRPPSILDPRSSIRRLTATSLSPSL